jgi:hypothetical protein
LQSGREDIVRWMGDSCQLARMPGRVFVGVIVAVGIDEGAGLVVWCQI